MTQTKVLKRAPESKASSHVIREGFLLSHSDFEEQNGHRSAVIWITGLSGSGKSTIAKALQKELFNKGRKVCALDGDNIRHGLCADLTFSAEDRTENIRRIGEVAKLFFENGHIVICSFISPFIKDRAFVRSLIPKGQFIEVFVDTPLDVCIQRDSKGLYKKAIAGEIEGFTGVDSPYEKPERPEFILNTSRCELHHLIGKVLNHPILGTL